jgi:uncharacterized MAPEG superfamily protein
MTIAYLCILVAALLPYVWVGIAKFGGKRYDNRDPRGWLAKQDDPRTHRAYSAQLNAFEAFAPFAAAVLMAQLAGVDPTRITQLALVFVALRVLHGLFYVGNKPTFRSLIWSAALLCVIALMVLAIARVSA